MERTTIRRNGKNYYKECIKYINVICDTNLYGSFLFYYYKYNNDFYKYIFYDVFNDKY